MCPSPLLQSRRTCPFCGIEFGQDEAQVACQGCPLAPSCGMLKCPRCGYEFPGEARLPALVKKLWRTRLGTK